MLHKLNVRTGALAAISDSANRQIVRSRVGLVPSLVVAKRVAAVAFNLSRNASRKRERVAHPAWKIDGGELNVASLVTPAGETSPIRASVCMATYNGAAYVEAQLRSILFQLGVNDEVVIVDDASSDDTLNVVSRVNDPRIRVVRLTKNVRHVRAFERAISEARGDYIFLSDQDDIWVDGRLDAMIHRLNSALVVASNWTPLGEFVPPHRRFVDEDPRTHSKYSNLGSLYLGRLPYFGCAMGFRREAVDLLLPFPRATEAHDLWIAIAGNVVGQIAHMERSTVQRRIHDRNLTPTHRRPVGKIIRSRVGMGILTITAYVRNARENWEDASWWLKGKR